MSFIGWPEFTNSVRWISGEAGADREMKVGLVSQVNVEYADVAPNMARGKGCWGRMVPEGSESPGRRWMGMSAARSSRWAERVNVGSGENVVES